MLLQPLLFILYLLLFCWLITRISFFKNTPLNKWWLMGIFLSKIIAGAAYAKIFAQPQYINTADTWNYYHASLTETDWLLHDPIAFVKDLFQYSYTNSGNLFNNQTSYWNDLKSNSIIKLIAVINVFTGKNYHTNIIFFNCLYLFGPAALFKIVMSYYPQQKWAFVFSVFLLPSFLFWCSGIHKDGLIFSAMMLIVYSLHQQLKQRKLAVKHCLLIIACLVILFALRNFVVLLLIPACVAWCISERYTAKKRGIFSIIYLLCIVAFFGGKYIHPALNFPQYVVAKQAEFQALTGNSKLDLPPLIPSFSGFIAFFPYAIDMAFLQPHWNAIKNTSYLAAAIENALLLLLIAAGAISAIRHKNILSFTLFLLFFSFSLLLLCGYTVTFAGAVVRYKSIATPLLATGICMLFPVFAKGNKNKL